MKTKHQLSIIYTILAVCAVLSIIFIEILFFRIALPCFAAFLAWMIYEFDHAPEINDDEMNY